jgi:UDP-2,3-diacylglucosamine pyrophosphatase LpxH
MNKIKFWVLLIVLLGLSFTDCNKDNQNDNSNNPFDNGSSERNMIVVISDLHMGADLAYSELNSNLEPLKKLLNNIKSSLNVKELVIAGDLLDEWFVPADVNTYNGNDQSNFIERIAIANKEVVDAFNCIIQEGKIKVTYVPGNHDLTITAENVELFFPGISHARDKELGLGTYSPTEFPEIVIEHGHRYNFFCAPDMISNQVAAPGTILPPGYFFTRIAALHVKQNCSENVDVIPDVSLNAPDDESQKLLYLYSEMWSWSLGVLPINNYFDEDIIVTNVNGFTDNFSVNDLLPYQSFEGGPIDVYLYNGIQDTWDERQTKNHVGVYIPVEHAIENANNLDETDNLAQTQYFLNTNSDVRIVVFGHNHRATIIPSYNHKGLKAIYANAGTWIDHNSAGSTATSVIITPQNDNASSLTKVALYNFEGKVYTEMKMDTIRL